MAKQGAVRVLITICLFIILEGGSLVMITNSSVFQRVKISGAVFRLSSWIQKTGSDVRYFLNLRKVNEEYRQENLRLIQELYRYKSAMREFIPAEVMIPADSGGNFSFMPAKVMINSTNQLQNYIVIDRGREDGVETDMGVISARGVVGIVSSISDQYAYVTSLLSVNQGISAKILPSNVFGTLIWDGKNISKAVLNDIPIHIPVARGDTICTSGYSSIFPDDLPLGTVDRFSIVKGAHYQIEVALFQDFSTLHYVNVVKNKDKEEINSVIEPNER